MIIYNNCCLDLAFYREEIVLRSEATVVELTQFYHQNVDDKRSALIDWKCSFTLTNHHLDIYTRVATLNGQWNIIKSWV